MATTLTGTRTVISVPRVNFEAIEIVPFTSLTMPSWALASEDVPFNQAAVLTLQWNFSSGGVEVLGFDVEIGEIELE